jgi:hypothetical protein
MSHPVHHRQRHPRMSASAHTIRFGANLNMRRAAGRRGGARSPTTLTREAELSLELLCLDVQQKHRVIWAGKKL